MEIPVALGMGLDKLASGMDLAKLTENASGISARYRSGEKQGRRLVTGAGECIAYAVSRMPATYCAVYSALGYALEAMGGEAPRTLMDIGAGTGAGSWAASELLPLGEITCVERESAMIRVGRELAAYGGESLKKAEWKQADVTAEPIPGRGELVIAAYILNELEPKKQAELVSALWEKIDKMLLLVEPGTPEGYGNLLAVRELLLKKGAHIAAPCPGEYACPIRGEDWCHFTCRVPRSKLHRQLKGGEAPYEDEKYAYLALCREPCNPPLARVLRHPQIGKGYIELEICRDGKKEKIGVTKKKPELFRFARKCACGDGMKEE